MQRLSASLAVVLVASLFVVSVRADDDVRSVNVTGTAIAKVKPDTVLWSVTVTTNDPNLKLAREGNDDTMQRVLALRGELGIDAKDVQTGHLNIRKIYERDRSGNQGAFRHYQFQRTVLLRQRDVKKFDDVLQQLTGTENIEVSYSLESSDFHKVRRETRLRAVAVAKEKAEEMTVLLGAKLGHVLSIDESSPGRRAWYSSPISNSAFQSGPTAEPDDIEGTFAPGSLEIRVSVDIRFAIRD